MTSADISPKSNYAIDGATLKQMLGLCEYLQKDPDKMPPDGPAAATVIRQFSKQFVEIG
jgi:hypothetical protein